MMTRRLARALGMLAVIAVLSSCSWVSGLFGSDDETKPSDISVFDAQVGDCFVAPAKVEVNMAELAQVPCDVAHQQELYAIVTYQGANDSGQGANDTDDYPGDAALDTFAKGACAEAFTGYVGIAYPDSGLWMTYLLPSARSWQHGKDRSVLCFVTTTAGGSLTQSVKGSKL